MRKLSNFLLTTISWGGPGGVPSVPAEEKQRWEADVGGSSLCTLGPGWASGPVPRLRYGWGWGGAQRRRWGGPGRTAGAPTWVCVCTLCAPTKPLMAWWGAQRARTHMDPSHPNRHWVRSPSWLNCGPLPLFTSLF